MKDITKFINDTSKKFQKIQETEPQIPYELMRYRKAVKEYDNEFKKLSESFESLIKNLEEFEKLSGAIENFKQSFIKKIKK
jgi:predicted  nucleic acid-binding Zn-ribbon protein